MIPDSPRNIATALFRIHSDHDCLVPHVLLLNIYPSPHCVLCEAPNLVMNREHLLECKALDKVHCNPEDQLVKYY